MSILIDDFGSGPLDVTIRTGADLYNDQPGTMLGGIRRTNLFVGLNALDQPAHLDNRVGFLNLSTGVGQYLRLELLYGTHVDAQNGGYTSLGNFAKMGTALRVNFHASDDLVINFNVLIWNRSGYLQYSDNVSFPTNVLPSTPTVNFPKDIPFSAFAGDLSDVVGVWFVFQTQADFSIDSIEII
jgi:hypothetical protein